MKCDETVTVVITGGSGGIGKVIAERALEEVKKDLNADDRVLTV